MIWSPEFWLCMALCLERALRPWGWNLLDTPDLDIVYRFEVPCNSSPDSLVSIIRVSYFCHSYFGPSNIGVPKSPEGPSPTQRHAMKNIVNDGKEFRMHHPAAPVICCGCDCAWSC